MSKNKIQSGPRLKWSTGGGGHYEDASGRYQIFVDCGTWYSLVLGRLSGTTRHLQMPRWQQKYKRRMGSRCALTTPST